MTDSPHLPQDNLVNNDVYDGLRLRSLQQLAWGIEASVGQFKLILVRCNYASLRDRLIERLREICQVEIRLLVVQESRRTLYTAIREEFGEDVPGCVMVVGLETVQNLAVMLTSANQVREEFRNNFAFPLVLWIDDEIYKQLIHVAPDLESWAITRNFAIAKDDLITLLQQLAEQYFSNTLTLNLDAYFVLEAELAAAQRELLDDAQVFQEVKANLASLLGLATQVNNKIDVALEHYQVALALWHQLNHLERWGKTLGDIAFCYYLKAFQHENITHPDWQATRHYIQEYISFLSQAERLDLIADSIFKFGVVLRDLQEWEHLKNLAGQALEIHQANNQAIELAKDYGFLAEIALAEERWLEANQFALQALNIGAPSGAILPAQKVVVSNDLSLYRFILARSQYHLGDYQEAIRNLEAAKDIGNPLTDLRLYLKILGDLQKLYFQQKAYLPAYEMKQQQRSVEQQFGLRAFIGAGRLQATKQVGAQGLAPLRIDNKDSIAPEIAASGRQLDVERLIERIGRPDKKLIVIYGQSGVGKSSLVNAGLVPALKNKAIGILDNLPVTMRVYTNWVEELGRLLGRNKGDEGDGEDEGELELQVLTSEPQRSASEPQRSTFELETSTSELETSTSELGTSASELGTSTSELESSTSELESSTSELESSTSELESSTSELGTSTSNTQNLHSLLLTPHSLISQLRENEQRNLRTILIFDQFEEFFFVYTEPKQRREFFEFLGECLNVLSVKVILSLRLDYLHYLLECNRFSSMKIIGNDILSNNVLYELGNFSPDDAKSIIQRLTEKANFQLQPALVEQLVQDLAGELGEVRPIELQVVGAQLQTENITTLAEYQQLGTKEELVKRYLDEVVNDCGVENQQVAELLLYLLTDEKGTRPLKTRAQLERDLQALSADATTDGNKLDLVLEIFVKSGLVVLLPENPFDRYQLVHDYIALFIRQQQEPKLKDLIAELAKEREQRRLSEEKLSLVEQANQILAEAQEKAKQEPSPRSILPGWEAFIAAMSFTGCLVILRAVGLLQFLEFGALDQFFRLRPNESLEERITIVVIDEASLDEVGSWPIPDTKIAQLLQKLNVHKPRAIGLDIYRNLLVESGNQELRNAYKSMPNLIGIELLANDKNVNVLPPAGLNQDQVGFNNVLYDLDGKVRRSLLYWHVDNQVHESFALKLALLYLKSKGITPTKAKNNPEYLQLGKATFTRFEANDGAYVGADARGYQILSNFPKPKCQSSSREFCSFRQVSMRDVLAGKVKENLIKDRIILIGSTAPSLQDFVFIPYSSSLINTAKPVPGIQLQAYFISELISAALQGRPLLKVWSDPVENLWIFVWSGFGSIFFWRSRFLGWSVASFILLVSTLIGSCYLAFFYGWWLPLVPSALVLFGSAIMTTAFTSNQLEKLRLHRTIDLILEVCPHYPAASRLAIEYLITSTNLQEFAAQTLNNIAVSALNSCKTSGDIAAIANKLAWVPSSRFKVLSPELYQFLEISRSVKASLDTSSLYHQSELLEASITALDDLWENLVGRDTRQQSANFISIAKRLLEASITALDDLWENLVGRDTRHQSANFISIAKSWLEILLN
ncbi:CHASE2 domain-containing protein [Nostoc sp. CHAB 5824]|nr:CHASE2 domain-containing protein [Nostoc sp. CHAB 5824]